MDNLSVAKWRKNFEADLIATMNEDAIGEYNDLLHRPATKLKEQLAELKQKKKIGRTPAALRSIILISRPVFFVFNWTADKTERVRIGKRRRSKSIMQGHHS
jgi:hypothetical protein